MNEDQKIWKSADGEIRWGVPGDDELPTFEERTMVKMTPEKQGVLDDLLRLATENEVEWRRFRHGIITDKDLEKEEDTARKYHHPDVEELREALALEDGAQVLDEEGDTQRRDQRRYDRARHWRLIAGTYDGGELREEGPTPPGSQIGDSQLVERGEGSARMQLAYSARSNCLD